MSNLSDKELDRISREAADSYEPDHSSLSWSRLEQKLEHAMPERPPDAFRFGRINPYVWGPAVVLLAGVSFFAVKNFHYSRHSTPTIQTIDSTFSAADANRSTASGNTVHLDSIRTRQNAVQADHAHSPATESPSASAAKHGAEAGIGNVSGSVSDKASSHSNAVSADKRISKSSYGSNILNSAAVATGSSVLSHASSAEQPNAADATGTGSKEADGLNNHTQIKNQIHLPGVMTMGSAGKVRGNDSLMNQLAQSKTPIHQSSLHLNRSLNIGFTFGPDYTSAGDVPNNEIGNNIGVTLGYYLTDKLSINTGFIYSNKFYWSKDHDSFRQSLPYAGSFATPPPIDYINSSSNIWELPLTLRYDFAHHNKTRFFANAGFSSYFMMKQTSIYFLHLNQNQLAFKTSNNEQKNYWFGIADLSVGFEAEIGKGFSFQAEPFFKLPLRNMGMENLKLTSYGFLMTFKYAPVLGRSKK